MGEEQNTEIMVGSSRPSNEITSQDPLHSDIVERDGYFQLQSTNFQSEIQISVAPSVKWQSGNIDPSQAEISFLGTTDEDTHTLSKADLLVLSLPEVTTSKEFITSFEEKFGNRWKELDITQSSTSDEIFEKLFPEVIESRKKAEEVLRSESLARRGL